MSHRPVNFAAGPAILAPEVLSAAARGVEALPDLGLSILEISHRWPTFDAIIGDARDRLRRLLGVPETHDILFLQGGARAQFAQVPLSFLRPGQQASYVLTGAWSKYALKEAGVLGQASVLATGEDGNFSELPSLADAALPPDTAYVHTTSNNTIFGTQWQELPDFGGARHVCDMSSDILSRPIDVGRFGLVYAGAQKNLGPAGVTLVIIDKAWMAEARDDIPSIWQYRVQAAKDSMFNTPPCFAIYVCGLAARWLEELGGVPAIQARNEQKAAMVYELIDASGGFYRGHVARAEHRSRMNVTWRTADPELEPRFVKEAEAEGLKGLKGHRSVGGLRASIYNAMPVEGVERLVDFMQRFARAHG